MISINKHVTVVIVEKLNEQETTTTKAARKITTKVAKATKTTATYSIPFKLSRASKRGREQKRIGRQDKN